MIMLHLELFTDSLRFSQRQSFIRIYSQLVPPPPLIFFFLKSLVNIYFLLIFRGAVQATVSMGAGGCSDVVTQLNIMMKI